MLSRGYWQRQAVQRHRLSRRAFLGSVGAVAGGVALSGAGKRFKVPGPGETAIAATQVSRSGAVS